LCATKKAANAAKESADAARFQSRPWVVRTDICLVETKEYLKNVYPSQCPSIGKPEVLNRITIGDKITWWVELSNVGQNPAFNNSFQAGLCISPNKEDDPPKWYDCRDQFRDKGAAALTHGIDSKIAIGPMNYTLTAKELDSVLRKEQRLYIIGHSEYSEWENLKAHSTDFCVLYAPHGAFALRDCTGGQGIN